MKKPILNSQLTQWSKKMAFAFLGMCMIQSSTYAQNMLMHYNDPGVKTIDYIQGMPWGDGYYLGGTHNPPNVESFNNHIAPWGNLGRIRLQATDETLNTQMYMTYVENEEIILMQESGCGSLNLNFTATDTKQTSDGGAIICGRVNRNKEMSNCGGAIFDEPYILKVDAKGTVNWYMRYDKNANFTSIVQDKESDNYIVCGSYDLGNNTSEALIMAVDNGGSFMWATNTKPPSGKPYSSSYSEIAPFIANGKLYYAVVGNEIVERFAKNMLVTIIDAYGNHHQDLVIRQNKDYDFIRAWGVHDNHDEKHIVITGEASFNYMDGQPNMPMIMQIEPFGANISFVNGYSMYYDKEFFTIGVGRSISKGNDVDNHISVTGHSIYTDWQHGGNLWKPNGMYLEVDNNGMMVRYTHIYPKYAFDGLAIVNNTSSNFPAFVGFNEAMTHSFGIRNNYGHDKCAENIEAKEYEIPTYIKSTEYYSLEISQEKYMMLEFKVERDEYLVCGMPKPAKSTGINTIMNTSDIITLSPNPVNNILHISAKNVMIKNIIVYDITGRMIMNQTAAGNKTSLDISELNTGTYILQTLTQDGNIHNQKFVKE